MKKNLSFRHESFGYSCVSFFATFSHRFQYIKKAKGRRELCNEKMRGRQTSKNTPEQRRWRCCWINRRRNGIIIFIGLMGIFIDLSSLIGWSDISTFLFYFFFISQHAYVFGFYIYGCMYIFALGITFVLKNNG